jgi:carbonic anhydrase/acetyltransferase-like protein (isoleucine patch superfamily)
MIGIGAIVLSGAKVGAEAIVGAGSVVLEETKIPPRVLAVGAPARIVRKLTQREINEVRGWVKKYIQLIKVYKNG